MTAAKTRKMNRNEIAIARVAQVIAAGHVLVAHNALAHEDTTVGTYHEAVDSGIRFAVLGMKANRSSAFTAKAEDAAEIFVMERVGSSRANDAAKAAAKRHGLVLAV
jgi:hypothetical protein